MNTQLRRTIEVDVLIIGAGPVGLYGAYYAGFRGLSVGVMDSLPEPGGQISAMYPEKLIYDIAGFPTVKGRELVERLLAQAGRFSPHYLLGEQADQLERLPDGRLRIVTASGAQMTCRAVVIAGGIGRFAPRPIPAGQEFLGRGLEHFVPRPDTYAGKDVVIVGGGDSACDWALALEPVARSVTLVHRREAFRAHRHTVDLLRRSSVKMLTPYTVSGLQGTARVESVEISEVKAKTTRTLACDEVVAALGFTADLGSLESWGLTVRDRRILVDSRMSTGVHLVYAAGDIADYEGKVRLIAVGFGEVATAVNNAAVALDPDLELFPGHSTDVAA
jgi:thioredoxin reductase (NADPH)